MKKMLTKLNRVSRTAFSLILCMMTLLGSMPAALGQGVSNTVEGEDLARIMSRTPRAVQTANMTDVTKSITGKITLKSTGEDIAAGEGGTGPIIARDAAINVNIDFVLKDDTRLNYGAGDIFTYNLSSLNLIAPNVEEQKFTNARGEHLMTYNITGNVITMTFTEAFFDPDRDIEKVYCNFDTTLNSTTYVGSSRPFTFPGGNTVNVNLAVGSVGVQKGFTGLTWDHDAKTLKANYTVSFYAGQDTLDSVVLTDVSGSKIGTPENVKLFDNGVEVTEAGRLTVGSSGGNTTFTVTDVQRSSNYRYQITYSADMPYEDAMAGGISTSDSTNGTNGNKIDYTWKKGTQTGEVKSSNTVYATYVVGGNVVLVKNKGALSADGKSIVYNITATTSAPVKNLQIWEHPILPETNPNNYKGNTEGTFAHVPSEVEGDTTALTVGTVTVGEGAAAKSYPGFTIANPIYPHTYNFTYTVPLRLNEVIGGVHYSSAYDNYVSAKWTVGETTYSATKNNRYGAVNPNSARKLNGGLSAASPSAYMGVGSDGEPALFADFSIFVDSLSASYYNNVDIVKQYIFTDTMGENMTLVRDSVKVRNGSRYTYDSGAGGYYRYLDNSKYPKPSAETAVGSLSYTNGSNTFVVTIDDFNPTSYLQIDYTVQLKKSALDAGLLNSDNTDAAAVAGRTNTVTTKWKGHDGVEQAGTSSTLATYYNDTMQEAKVSKAMSYASSIGKTVNNVITFELFGPMDTVKLTEVYPLLFKQTDSSYDTSKIVLGGAFTTVVNAETGAMVKDTMPTPTLSYNELTFYSLPAGAYVVTIPVDIDYESNQLTYRDVQEDVTLRTNTVNMDYTRSGTTKSTFATATLAVPKITLEKTGEVQRDEDNRIITENGKALVKWNILLSSDTLIPNKVGSFTDKLMGRQEIKYDDTFRFRFNTQVNRNPSYEYGWYSVASYASSLGYTSSSSTIGSKQYEQIFNMDKYSVYSYSAYFYEIEFYSLAELPATYAEVTSANQVVYKHPVWGSFEAEDEVTYEWGGTVPITTISKGFVSADTSGDRIKATWKITINIPSGHEITNVILSDYLNFREPEAYIDLNHANVRMNYVGETGGPTYSPPVIMTDADGNDRMSITFTQNLSKSVEVYITTLHENENFTERDVTYRNFADLEFSGVSGNVGPSGDHYQMAHAEWTLNKIDFEKSVNEDAPTLVNGKYVMDWTIRLNDATRVGQNVIIKDALPPGTTWDGANPTIVGGTRVGAVGSETDASGNQELTFTYRHTAAEAKITFRTYINDAYLHLPNSFLNTARLMSRTQTDKVIGTAAALAPFTPVRTLEKSGSDAYYDEDLDQYVIDWTVTLNDPSRKGQYVGLRDTLPSSLTLVPNSVQAVGANGGTPANPTVTANSFLMTFRPIGDEVTLTFRTTIANSALKGSSSQQTVSFRNVVGLLPMGFSSSDDPIQVAEDTVHIPMPVRQLTKEGNLRIVRDSGGDDQYLVDWTIILREDARAGFPTMINDLLNPNIAFDKITSVTAVDETGETVAITKEEMTAVGARSKVKLRFTPNTSTTIITLTHEVDASSFASGSTSVTYNNTAQLVNKQETVLEEANATLQVSGAQGFQKTGQVVLDDEGRYMINWTLLVTGDLLSGTPLRVEDILPEGLTLATDLVTVTSRSTGGDANIDLTPDSITPPGADRKFSITFTPVYKQTLIYLPCYIDKENLFYENGGVEPTYLNSAVVYNATSNEKMMEDSATIPFGVQPKDVLEKSKVDGSTGSNRVQYTIEINSLEMDLGDGASTITLYDEISKNLTLLTGSIRLYDGKDNTVELPTSDFSAQYNSGTRILSITVQNRKHLLLTFEGLVNGRVGTSVDVTNTISLKGDGTITSEVEGTYTVTAATAGVVEGTDYVEIIKVDENDSSKKIAGASFALYQANPDNLSASPSALAYGQTNSDGVLVLGRQAAGQGLVKEDILYYVQETAAAPGYLLSDKRYYFIRPSVSGTAFDTLWAKVVAAGIEDEVLVSQIPTIYASNVIDLKTRLTIEKVNASGKLLSGAELEIWKGTADAPGTNAADKVYGPFTSGAVPTTLENVIATIDTSTTFWLVETKAPEGYILAEPVSFKLTRQTVTHNGKTITIGQASVSMEDSTPSLSVAKRNSNSMTGYLGGASMQLEDSEGNVLHTWTSSDSGPEVITSGLEVGKTYTIRETRAPAGFYFFGTSKVQYVKIDATGKAHVVDGLPKDEIPDPWWTSEESGASVYDFINEPYKVEISKVDEDGNGLAGAGLAIYKSPKADNPTALETWTSTTDPHVPETVLVAGNYILSETSTPGADYLLADDVAFSISHKGTVHEVEMVNKRNPKIEVAVEKKWEDDNNQDGVRPTSVTIQLVRNTQDVAGSTLVLNAANSWKGKFENLSSRNPQTGEAYTYTVRESSTLPDGYTAVTTGSDNSFVITNTRTSEKVSVLVTKVWEDGNYSSRPTSIKLQLTKSVDGGSPENVGGETTVNAVSGNTWTHTFSNLPKYQGGKLITYDVREVTVPTGYQSSKVTTAVNSYTITNSLTRLTVKKVATGTTTQLAGATFSIFEKNGDGSVGAKVEGSTFTTTTSATLIQGLLVPGKAYYVVEEKAPNNYLLAEKQEVTFTAGDMERTLTFEDDPNPNIKVAVTKEWDDEDDQDSKRPESVTVMLYADLALGNDTPVKTQVLNEANSWTITWDNLPKYRKDVLPHAEIVYTVDEAAVSGYTKQDITTKASTDVDLATKHNFVITNSYTPETIDVTVNKVWKGGTEPDSVQVQLMAGTDTVTNGIQTLTKAGGWTYTWRGLPKKKAGSNIQYTAVEVSIPSGFDFSATTINSSNVVTVTNTATKLTVIKYAEDGTTPLKDAEFSIFEKVVENGVASEGKLITSWTSSTSAHVVTGLLEVGKTYIVRETKAPVGYVPAEPRDVTIAKGDVEHTLTFTNTKSELTDFTVTKSWLDSNNQDRKRPDSIQVQLYDENGAYGTPVTLNSTNSWTYTWKDLPKSRRDMADAQDVPYRVDEISYTVGGTTTEGVAPGYDKEIVVDSQYAYTIKNSYTPATIDITVEKAWSGATPAAGTEVQVKLYANGTEVEDSLQTLTATGGWTHTWNDLPKNANGVAITYLAKEVAVPAGFDSTSAPTTASSAKTIVTNTATKLTVIKNDTSGTAISGAKFEIYEVGEGDVVLDDTAIAEWVSDGTPHDVTGILVVGKPYVVREIEAPSGYVPGPDQRITFVAGTPNRTLTFVNATNPTVTFRAKKVWVDNNNQDGYRPSKLDIQLYADGEEYPTTMEANESNGWEVKWENLPKYRTDKPGNVEIEYKVMETTIPGSYYEQVITSSTNNYTITNTHESETIDVTVKKVWSGGTAKDSVEVILLANGLPVETEATTLAASSNPAENWQHTWTGLAKNAGGTAITYTVQESNPPDGFDISMSEMVTSGDTNTITVTNTATKLTIIKLDANKAPLEGARFSIFEKRSDGTEGTEVTSWTSGASAHVVEGLLVVGKEYIVRETLAPFGYVPDEPQTIQFEKGTPNKTITFNNAKSELTTFKVTKSWDDNNDQDKIRPSSIIVQLTADGVAYDDPNTTGDQGKVTLSGSGWTHTWTSLPKNRRDIYPATAIEYKVDEVDAAGDSTVPEGYTKTIDDSKTYDHTITNSYTPEETQVVVQKEWVEDTIGNRPSQVTVKLFANDVFVEGSTQVLTADESWKFTYQNLPKKAAGVDIVYSVQEHVVPGGYSSKVEDISDGKITITNTTTKLTINKVKEGTSTPVVGAKMRICVKNVDGSMGDQKAEWTTDGTPYDVTGVLVIGQPYYVYEYEAPDGYTLAARREVTLTAENPRQTITIDDPVNPVTDFTVTKIWDDANNQDGYRKGSISVQLYADGTAYGEPVLLKADTNGDWTHTWEDLPKNRKNTVAPVEAVVYTVDEAEVPEHYTKTIDKTDPYSHIITNSHTPEETEVHVVKTWVGGTLADRSPITVKLFANGVEVADSARELSESVSWKTTYSKLPKRSNGTDIVYTAEEDKKPAGFMSSISGRDADTKTITVTNTATKLTISKVDEKGAALPGAILYIYEATRNDDGTFTQGAEVTHWETTSEAHVVTALLEVGKWYLVVETSAPEGYLRADPKEVRFTETELEKTVQIVDKKNPETSFIVTKVWDDANNQDGNRPDEIYMQLMGDSDTIGSAEKLDESNKWTHTWTGLPVYKHNVYPLEEITYTVDETLVPVDYTRTINSDVKHNHKITNSYTPKTIDLTVVKNWIDPAAAGTPTEIQVQLYADGVKKGDPKTITKGSDGTWKTLFEGLPRYKDGAEIVYTIQELNSPKGYYAKVSDLVLGSVEDDSVFEATVTLTNTLTQLTVQKVKAISTNGVPSEKGVANATLEIWKGTEANPRGTKLHTFQTGAAANGENVLPGILTGGELAAGESYWLVETDAPTGFVVADPVPFTLDTDTNNTRVKMVDPPTIVVLKKVNTSGDLLVGADLEIKQGNTVLQTVTTTNETQIFEVETGLFTGNKDADFEKGSIVLVGVLDTGITYTVHETNPPLGYSLPSSDLTFSILGTETLVEKEILNEEDKNFYDVWIYKVDQFGNQVIGATLQLTDLGLPDGHKDKVETWVTDGKPYKLRRQASTTARYVLDEIEVPEGYQKPTEFPYSFQIAKQMLVSMGGTMVLPITATNFKTDTIITGTKVWKTPDGQPLANPPDAVIELYRKVEGDTTLEYVTETTPTLNTETNKYEYRFKEDASDANGKEYIYSVVEKAMSSYYTVQENETHFTNYATQLTITKTKPVKAGALVGEKLGGAELALYKYDASKPDFRGEMVGTSWNTSDENPKVFTGELDLGTKYVLAELSTPLGYLPFEDEIIEFPASPTAPADISITRTMVDELVPWDELSIDKVNTDGTRLYGARMALYRADENDEPILPAIREWDSGTSASFTLKNLDPTYKYILKELNPPAGFALDSDLEDGFLFSVMDAKRDDGKIFFEFENAKMTIRFTNRQNAVNVDKLAQDTGLLLEGAVMEIWKVDAASPTLVRRWTTGASTQLIHGLAQGSYKLQEKSPPAGYASYTYAVAFTVDKYGQVQEGDRTAAKVTATSNTTPPVPELQGLIADIVTINMTDPLLNYSIQKVNPENEPLIGAEMELHEGNVKGKTSAATLVHTWTSASTPELIGKDDSGKYKLTVGKTYTLHEVKPPKGYSSIEDTVIVIGDEADYTLKVVDPLLKVTIVKQDNGAPANPVVGAVLELTKAGDTTFKKTWTTDGKPMVFEGEVDGLEEGSTYTLKEISAPGGYMLVRNPMNITLSKATSAAQKGEFILNMVDPQIDVRVQKVDNAGKNLAGVELQLYKAENKQAVGSALAQWNTSNANPYRLPYDKLKEGDSYLIREVSAPAGYTIADDVHFTVSADKLNSAGYIPVTVTNQKTKVSITKVNQGDKKPLAGAKLRVVDPSNGDNTVFSWTSSSQPQVLEGLLVGGHTYKLVEDSAPTGYGIAEPITFTVPTYASENDNGKGIKNGVLSFQMEDPIQYRFAKSEIGSTAYLPGATLCIIDSSGKVVVEAWVTNTQDHIVTGTLQPGQRYMVVEVETMEGFYPAGSIPFSISASGQLLNSEGAPASKITVLNLRLPGTTPTPPRGGGNTGGGTNTATPVPEVTATPYVPPTPTPTPFATATPNSATVASSRTPVGVRFVDGQWVYIDENDIPLGVVPLTGDSTNWIILAAAALIPLLGAAIGIIEIRRRNKRKKTTK